MDQLKVFSVLPSKFSSNSKFETRSNKKNSKKAPQSRPPKKNYSPSEIKAKVQKNTAPKEQVSLSPKGKKFGEGFMKEAESTEPEKAVGAVGLNKPGDPMTGEKLKGILSSGAFGFSSKEKDVLSKILETN